MAGIYIHIPFCTKRCTYCDFYFVIGKSSMNLLQTALLHELRERKHEIQQENITSVYFGGGTPSLMPVKYLSEILVLINQIYNVDESVEITLEANPDNLTIEYLSDLKTIGINRLSIGIQSLNQSVLNTFNRSHTVRQAVDAVNNSFIAGFTNISIDMIYGLPDITEKEWIYQMTTVTKWPVTHISCYALTVEPKTPLYKQVNQHKINLPSDSSLINQYQSWIDISNSLGFQQYELSNFCKDNFYSRHNSAYWNLESCLGIGPSAHSFTNKKRSYHSSVLTAYINNPILLEEEIMTPNQQVNEYIMIRLRTVTGIVWKDFIALFGNVKQQHIYEKAINWKDDSLIHDEIGMRIPPRHFMISDYIISQLFLPS